MKRNKNPFFIGFPSLMLFFLFVLAGCTQPPEQKEGTNPAVAECNALLKSDWNAGFECVLSLEDKLARAADCQALENLDNPDPDSGLTDFKSLCAIKVATAQGDSAACSSIASFSEQETLAARNTCFMGVAQAKKDPALCEKMVSAQGKTGKGTQEYELCMIGVATKASDCNALSSLSAKDSCINSIAKKTEDAQLCQEISSRDTQYNCVQYLASVKKDWTLCNALDQPNADACIQIIAIQTRNAGLCDQIETSRLREGCKNLVRA
ncbi:hypothetical protein J4419_03095 [Candidatus Woesearchaeota archaeon]|nr:hypothetical protein [Candidatus Woesearchaeota archaeon]